MCASKIASAYGAVGVSYRVRRMRDWNLRCNPTSQEACYMRMAPCAEIPIPEKKARGCHKAEKPHAPVSFPCEALALQGTMDRLTNHELCMLLPRIQMSI